MTDKRLSTDAYKGVRDFYPEDAAIQQYMFDVWTHTAESYGYEKYDASILEPAELYKAKGSRNEEMVNDQTYTFTDRGDREVTLRPEMTPTVARMVAAKQRELTLPLRWYSIPNLFRYERPQKGRLREHWQLNCDIFGSDDFTADVELIALAYDTLINFGVQPDQFGIRINDRALMTRLYKALGVDEEKIGDITRLNDRKDKIDDKEYRQELKKIVEEGILVEQIIMMLESSDEQTDVVVGLAELGITNVEFDKMLARGFDYYTGTIFEFFDATDEKKKAILGGGRYDNLTELFGTEKLPGVGFGLGDVRLRDFLEKLELLPEFSTSYVDVVVIPAEPQNNLAAHKAAVTLREKYDSVLVDISTKKLNKKMADANTRDASYAAVIGDNEVSSGSFSLKNLETGEEKLMKL